MTTAKSLLAVISKPPYGNATAKEALDAVLTAAAFEVPTSLLFIGDGVFQLATDQQPDGIRAKNLSATLPVLPMYDVEHIYADQQSLTERGLVVDQLLIPVVALDAEAIKHLFQQQDKILSF